MKLARSIGIAVDHRRRNRSLESLQVPLRFPASTLPLPYPAARDAALWASLAFCSRLLRVAASMKETRRIGNRPRILCLAHKVDDCTARQMFIVSDLVHVPMSQRSCSAVAA